MFSARHPALRAAVSEMARERTEMNVMRAKRAKQAEQHEPSTES